MAFNINRNRTSVVSNLLTIALIGICITTTSATAMRGTCQRSCRIVAAKCEERCAGDLIGKGRSALVESSRRTECATECFTSKTVKEVDSTTASDHVTEEERQTWNEELETLDVDARTLEQLCRTNAFKDAKVCKDKKNKQENMAHLKTVTLPRISVSHDDKTAPIPKRVIERLLRNTRSTQGRRPIRRRRSENSSMIEICPKTTISALPITARHWKSKKHVQLLVAAEANLYGLATNFTKQGYRQEFKIVAGCGELVTNYEVAGYKNLHCKPMQTLHLADFIIGEDTTTSSQRSDYDIETKCRSVGFGRAICRDWVMLDTYCALHGTTAR